jgi:hypothetical protein
MSDDEVDPEELGEGVERPMYDSSPSTAATITTGSCSDC